MFDIHAARFDLGEIQNIVDDGEQGIARVADRFSVIALFVVEFGIEQESAHADDGIHRGADLMTHGRKEGTLGFVSLFGSGAGDAGIFEETRILDGRCHAGCDGFHQRNNGFIVGVFMLEVLNGDAADEVPADHHRDHDDRFWNFVECGHIRAEAFPQCGRLAVDDQRFTEHG